MILKNSSQTFFNMTFPFNILKMEENEGRVYGLAESPLNEEPVGKHIDTVYYFEVSFRGLSHNKIRIIISKDQIHLKQFPKDHIERLFYLDNVSKAFFFTTLKKVHVMRHVSEMKGESIEDMNKRIEKECEQSDEFRVYNDIKDRMNRLEGDVKYYQELADNFQKTIDNKKTRLTE